jgi:hypothetical protein
MRPVFSAPLVLTTSALVLAQLPQGFPPGRLAVSRPIARRIPAASTHQFAIDLEAGDRAAITITMRGRLDVAIYFPDGKLSHRPKPPGPDGEQDFAIAAERPGSYRIEITNSRGKHAEYEIVVDNLLTVANRQRANLLPSSMDGRDQQVTDDDLRLLQHANDLLSSESVWNRHDTRICLPDEKKLSLFCALEKSQLDLFREYRHRAGALQEVRFAIEDVTDGRKFEHRLMDFNNLQTTRFADIKLVLTIATHRVRVRLNAQNSVGCQERSAYGRLYVNAPTLR